MDNFLEGQFHSLSVSKTDRIKTISSIKFSGVSDQKIWEEFREGDESAFIYIYSGYFKELISFGYQFCRDVQLIEDCIQDLFVNLRRKREKLSPIKHSIRLYLFQGLKRRILDYQKKLKKISLEDNMETYIFEITLPQETHIINEQVFLEIRERLERAIRQLSGRQREALYYLYFKNMSYEEIKIMMEMKNIKSVRNLIYKALSALKPMLESGIFSLPLLLKFIIATA